MSVVCGETGDQTDQEPRSASHGAATSVIAMDITIHASFRFDPGRRLSLARKNAQNGAPFGPHSWQQRRQCQVGRSPANVDMMVIERRDLGAGQWG
jgi:hypothetical protein